MFQQFVNFITFVKNHILKYPTPASLTYLWSFGSIAGFFLTIQIISGLFLSMHYIADVSLAFDSVESISRNVNFGWLVKSVHANGASFFFLIVYIHIGRAIYFRSFTHLFYVWISGVIIFILMMATAFLGYVLPWGQMSLWGATVITNLFSAIPFFGKAIVGWLWGGYAVDSPTLMRFYTLHFIMPFIIVVMVIIHLLLLHINGSTSPSQSFVNDEESLRFSSYFFVKDLFSFLVVLFFFGYIVFFYPNFLGHPDNYIPANPLATPVHIVPEWYFLPFYAILRAIPNKLGGVVLMFSSIIILFFINIVVSNKFIYTKVSRIKDEKLLLALNNLFRKDFWLTEFQLFYKIWFWFFSLNFILLGYLGSQPAVEPFITISLYATFFYFFALTIGLVIVQNIEYRFFLSVYTKKIGNVFKKNNVLNQGNNIFKNNVIQQESEKLTRSAMFCSPQICLLSLPSLLVAPIQAMIPGGQQNILNGRRPSWWDGLHIEGSNFFPLNDFPRWRGWSFYHETAHSMFYYVPPTDVIPITEITRIHETYRDIPQEVVLSLTMDYQYSIFTIMERTLGNADRYTIEFEHFVISQLQREYSDWVIRAQKFMADTHVFTRGWASGISARADEQRDFMLAFLDRRNRCRAINDDNDRFQALFDNMNGGGGNSGISLPDVSTIVSWLPWVVCASVFIYCSVKIYQKYFSELPSDGVSITDSLTNSTVDPVTLSSDILNTSNIGTVVTNISDITRNLSSVVANNPSLMNSIMPATSNIPTTAEIAHNISLVIANNPSVINSIIPVVQSSTMANLISSAPVDLAKRADIMAKLTARLYELNDPERIIDVVNAVDSIRESL